MGPRGSSPYSQAYYPVLVLALTLTLGVPMTKNRSDSGFQGQSQSQTQNQMGGPQGSPHNYVNFYPILTG